MQKLDDSWILVDCGSKTFAINQKYIESFKVFDFDTCYKSALHPGIYRGTYKVLKEELIILDARKILGEKTTQEEIEEFKRQVSDLSLGLLEIQSQIQLCLITNYSDEKLESKLNKISNLYNDTLDNITEFMNGITDEQCKNRYRVNNNVIELNVLFKASIEKLRNKDDRAWQTFKEIEYSINRLQKELDRIIENYAKSFTETVIIIIVKGKKLGLVVDKISKVTKESKLIYTSAKFKYKAIAGECIVDNKQYYIFNTTYLMDLADKLGN